MSFDLDRFMAAVGQVSSGEVPQIAFDAPGFGEVTVSRVSSDSRDLFFEIPNLGGVTVALDRLHSDELRFDLPMDGGVLSGVAYPARSSRGVSYPGYVPFLPETVAVVMEASGEDEPGLFCAAIWLGVTDGHAELERQLGGLRNRGWQDLAPIPPSWLWQVERQHALTLGDDLQMIGLAEGEGQYSLLMLQIAA